MKKENFYAIIIVALLVLNLGTLGYLWFNANKHTPPPRPLPKQAGALAFMSHELDLDKKQLNDLKVLAHRHRKALDSVQRHIRDAQTQLFRLAKSDVLDTVARNQYLQTIEDNESAKHLITLLHFQEIRGLLNEDQKVLFNEFIEDIGKQITNPNPPLHGRPGHGGPPPPRH